MTTIIAASSSLPPALDRGELQGLVDFYTCTDADYGAWSRDFNMHFGLCDADTSPFDRESMLERMNAAVGHRLGVATRLVDLGCGTGATARALVRARPDARVSGVTIVPAQVTRGRNLNAASGLSDRIDMVLADYTATGLASEKFDGAYAIESACHARGTDKRALLTEAHRLLAPGGRLVIADCFLRHCGPIPSWIRPAYRAWCRNWAVPELARLPALRSTFREIGFSGLHVEDISWKVAPSVAHVPFVATGFLLAELWNSRGRIPEWRRRHIAASWLSIALGLCRGTFGYFLVSARKAG